MLSSQRNRKPRLGGAQGGTLSNGVTPHRLVSLLSKKGLTLAIAESCTGGLICHKLTAIPCVSEVFKEGIICYSNTSKIKRLGVKPGIIEKYGAVSPEVCRLMAQNVTKSEKSDLGISVTGIAGPAKRSPDEYRCPEGGTPAQPVGLVYIGVNIKGKITVHKYNFMGSRKNIQEKAARTALQLLEKNILS
ncbi:MAG: CinA family protein [Planctomycetes bacterium]|nr:CinA family protein [Planctomycetota bacterium]